ncbi:MAG: alpha/beta hydrolase, partial [Acidimicrobiia bacterium]
ALFAAVLVAVLAAGCLVPPVGPAPLRYRDEVFSAVTKTANITYAAPTSRHTGQPVTLQADVYRPTDDTLTSRPAVIWVHGGGFSGGNRTSPEIVDEANTFARKGFVSVSMSYRLSPTGCSAAVPTAECLLAIVDALTDAQSAVRWLRANAATYGVDATRVASGGSSAGAITALNVGYNGDAPRPEPLPEVSSRVQAAVLISGSALAGGISAGDAPSLLFHGTNDFVVPYAWGENTVNAARAAGLTSWLISWRGSGHVPYVENRTQILDLTTNFLYQSLGLAAAAR